MKYAIIIMDGAADEPLEQLGGQTVLEAAKIPHIDRISQAGQLGMAHTVVKPPLAAAPVPVAIVSLSWSPGSLR